LFEKKAPVDEITSPYKKKRQEMQDQDDEFLTNQIYSFNLMDKVDKKVEKKERTPSPPKQLQIILSGLVLMKTGWLFYKPRLLVLNNQPRLTYFDPETKELKVYKININYNEIGRNSFRKRYKR